MNYFLCNTAALQADLTKSTFAVYQYLAMAADNKTRKSWPSVPTIAAKIGVSTKTVTRATKELAAKELIEIVPRFRKNGSQTSNYYILKDTKENTRTYACKTQAAQVALTGTEQKVYHCLSARAGKKDECYPSAKQIAADCKISVSTVWRCVKKLTATALITVRRQWRSINDKLANSKNRYLLTTPKCDTISTCPTKISAFTYILSFIFSFLSLPLMSCVSPPRTMKRMNYSLKKGRSICSKLIKRSILWHNCALFSKHRNRSLK